MTRNKLHLQTVESMSPLGGGGAYCGGPTTGRTAWFTTLAVNVYTLQWMQWIHFAMNTLCSQCTLQRIHSCS